MCIVDVEFHVERHDHLRRWNHEHGHLFIKHDDHYVKLKFLCLDVWVSIEVTLLLSSFCDFHLDFGIPL